MDNNLACTIRGIPVSVEHSSGNIEPLLHEIRHALTRLLEAGVATCIDLKSIPLAPGEEERLVAMLGVGEVRAELTTLGPSEVAETDFAGVWLVTHRDEAGATVARFIEVAFIPEILRSQTLDIADGLERLEGKLNAVR